MLARDKLRVLVVDDSAFFRHRIQEVLTASDELLVVGTASNGRQAVELAERLNPDVITMDVEMPLMDGITAVRQIMAKRRVPILMFSSLTHEGARATLDALDAGAVDFLPKQVDQYNVGKNSRSDDLLCRRVLEVARSRVSVAGLAHSHKPTKPLHRPEPSPHSYATGRADAARSALASTRQERSAVHSHREPAAPVNHESPVHPARIKRRRMPRLVAIGASTGGPVALQKVLESLPRDFPLPLLLAVHMPAAFTPAYAQRLNSVSRIQVKEAVDGDPLIPGQALLAPGGRQLLVEGHGDRAIVRVLAGGDETYKPSVDVLLGSAARAVPGGVLGIVLTGMGSDGKQGAKLLRSTGSQLWSQDAASCVVYGMPQAVEKAGLCDHVLPLTDIGPTLARLVLAETH